ncbi:hypothetical protein D1007_17011 [Hordeum vulgare]|nr:hypothetical protein D1007_17011 [Hordeum vulgare]
MTDKATDVKWMTPCGAALLYHRSGSGFSKIPLQDSVKNWQRGFFYVKNVNPANDHINLPAFFDVPPIEKLNWKLELPHLAVEVEPMCAQLAQMV